MTQRLSLLILISLLVLAAAPALATTLVLGTDEELFDQAPLIVEGTVLSVGPAASGAPATEYRIRVERTVKGQAPAGGLTLRVLGGTGADGWTLTIWGAPELAEGERTLLFLDPYPDGAYRPLHLAMGVFHEVNEAGRKLALRDLSEMEDVGSGGPAPAVDRVRDFDRFSHWLADRAAGLQRGTDYFVDRSGFSGSRPFVEKYHYLGGFKQRWLEFDRGEGVIWQAGESGQPGLESGGFPEFQAALQAWNDDPGTNIRYEYGGTTSSTNGFKQFDGINAILFEDPNGEVGRATDGTTMFTCSSPGRGSGILAVGGTWTDGRDEPIVIGGADIIVNDGAGCWFSTGKRAEQVYGHELGHTLGLGHSCGDSRTGECIEASKDAQTALMRASAFSDDRGARLNEDDRTGIFTLYPGEGGGGTPSGGKPAKPTDLKAVAASSTSIDLTWKDNARNETSYRVEIKPPGGSFQPVGSLPAGTTGATVFELDPGKTYTFRVQALSGSKKSPYSNQAKAKTPGSRR
jgi:hypothetical protein